ncbi:hypothetical protein D9M68_728720 [compost metagenome]
MVVGHRAQGPAGAGLLEEQREHRNQHRRHDGRDDVFLVDQHTAFEGAFKQEQRVLGHTHVDRVDVRAEDGLAQAVEEIGDAQRGHQQRHAFLVHQVAQHQAFDQPGQDEHAAGRDEEGDHVAEQLALQSQPLRYPLREAGHRQRGEQHHRTLCEVEDARGLEDQHEAERHQRIQHAGHQAAQQCFKKESHLVVSVFSGSCRGTR